MFALIVKLAILPGKRDEMVGILKSSAAEMPGCFSYVVAEDCAGENVIWVTEVWDGIASLSKLPSASSTALDAAPMKITPLRLVINGADWEMTRLAFHLKSNDLERSDRISLVGNDKQDYNLHFLFPEDKVPKGKAGDLWLMSSNREDEPFSVPVSFAWGLEEISGDLLQANFGPELVTVPSTLVVSVHRVDDRRR